jgi:biotin carboxyl carrier protein
VRRGAERRRAHGCGGRAACADAESCREVRIAVGQLVGNGQAVDVPESMKTETVLRAPADEVVRAIGRVKGERVKEGRELVDIGEGTEAVV